MGYIRSTEHGFTLIETLISLTLLTIILGAVYGSFFTVNQAFKRVDNTSLKYHEARLALDIIRREIESAIFRDNDKTPFIIKDRERLGRGTSELSFTSLSLSNNIPTRIIYFTEEKDGTLNLLKREAPFIHGSKEFTMDLIEDIKEFSVETLFNDRWVKTWDTGITHKPPELIRITIGFDDEGREVKLTEYAWLMTGKKL